MSREKQIEEKNCKECLHFEACYKWTDFPKQIGFPVCRKFTPTNTPTNTNLHQPCKSVQVEEIDELETVLYEANHRKSVLDYRWLATEAYNAGYRKQSEGEWYKIKDFPRHHFCNQCGKGNRTKANFCPNCGAKMKGGAE